MRFVRMRKPYALNYNQGALIPLDEFLLKSQRISHLRFVTICSLKFDYKRRGEKNISASTFKGLKCFVINAFLNQCHSRFAKLLALIRFAADSLQCRQQARHNTNRINKQLFNDFKEIFAKFKCFVINDHAFQNSCYTWFIFNKNVMWFF